MGGLGCYVEMCYFAGYLWEEMGESGRLASTGGTTTWK